MLPIIVRGGAKALVDAMLNIERDGIVEEVLPKTPYGAKYTVYHRHHMCGIIHYVGAAADVIFEATTQIPPCDSAIASSCVDYVTIQSLQKQVLNRAFRTNKRRDKSAPMPQTTFTWYIYDSAAYDDHREVNEHIPTIIYDHLGIVKSWGKLKIPIQYCSFVACDRGDDIGGQIVNVYSEPQIHPHDRHTIVDEIQKCTTCKCTAEYGYINRETEQVWCPGCAFLDIDYEGGTVNFVSSVIDYDLFHELSSKVTKQTNYACATMFNTAYGRKVLYSCETSHFRMRFCEIINTLTDIPATDAPDLIIL